jgi:hypothetical protein
MPAPRLEGGQIKVVVRRGCAAGAKTAARFSDGLRWGHDTKVIITNANAECGCNLCRSGSELITTLCAILERLR